MENDVTSDQSSDTLAGGRPPGRRGTYGNLESRRHQTTLLRHSDEVITRDELFDSIWGGRRTYDGRVSRLRVMVPR